MKTTEKEPVIFAINSVYCQPDNNKILSIGSLFFTNFKIYYLIYSLFDSNSDSSAKTQAMTLAYKKQTLNWGMSLNERKPLYRNVVIQRELITDSIIQIADNTLIFNTTGKQFEFIIPDIGKYEEQINEWLANQPTNGDIICSISSKFPAPKFILDNIRMNQLNDSQLLEDIAHDNDYFSHFYEAYRVYEKSDKKMIAKNIELFSNKFSDVFKDFIEQSQRKGKKYLFIGIGLIILTIILFFISIGGDTNGPLGTLYNIMIFSEYCTFLGGVISITTWYRMTKGYW